MSEIYKISNVESQKIEDISYELKMLAESFNNVGNREISEKLRSLSHDLDQCSKEINDTIHNDLKRIKK